MKTAAEYRAMADECFKWAKIWLNTASKLDGLPPTRTPPAPDEATKTTRSVGEG